MDLKDQKDINDWGQWNKLVVHQLDTFGDEFMKVRKQLTDIQVEIATLKVKAGLWGLIAGLIPAIVTLLLKQAQV